MVIKAHSKDQIQEEIQDGLYFFALGELQKSVAHFSEALRIDPVSHAARMGRGAAYAKMGRMEDAEADFSVAIESKPRDPRAYHFRGLARLGRGDRQAAIEDFSIAIEINPRYGIAYYSRGTARSELGDLDGAGADMAMAARLGEANLQEFSDYHNIWRTQFDKVEAVLLKEREADIAVKPDLTSWLD